jgi:CO/xanthine dehydrogenase FAD-binding subunit
MVLLEAGTLRHERFVSVWGLPELRGVSATADTLTIGALTTYTDLLHDADVRLEFPILCEAAAQTGAVATQNRGTIGGNIANGSPAADTPPALLVYDAELELVSARGSRRVRCDRFYTGYRTMDLGPDELIARVHLPRRPGWTAMYRKIGTRRAQAIAKVCFAAGARVEAGRVEDVRVVLGSVAPTVVRARRAEDVVRGTALDDGVIGLALETLMADIAPIDDIRSSAQYRASVSRQLLGEFLRSLRETSSPG